MIISVQALATWLDILGGDVTALAFYTLGQINRWSSFFFLVFLNCSFTKYSGNCVQLNQDVIKCYKMRKKKWIEKKKIWRLK